MITESRPDAPIGGFERACRAVCIRHGGDPDALGPGQTHVATVEGVPTIISDWRGPLWKMWASDVRAVLEAIREPDAEISQPGWRAAADAAEEVDEYATPAMVDSAFTAMIDAILAQGEG